MPYINNYNNDEAQEQIELLLRNINVIPLSRNYSEEDKANNRKYVDEYFNTKIINKDATPLFYYTVISELKTDEEQINFIKENIEYIKEHDEEIFIYSCLVPRELSNFLSFNVMKSIRELSTDIFRKMLSGGTESLYNKFSPEDAKDLFMNYKEDIYTLSNNSFRKLVAELRFERQTLTFYDHADTALALTSRNLKNFMQQFEEEESLRQELYRYMLDNYMDKVSTFEPSEVSNLLSSLKEYDTFIDFVDNNEKLVIKTLKDASQYEYGCIFEGMDNARVVYLLTKYFDLIITKDNINKILRFIPTEYIYMLKDKHTDIYQFIEAKELISVLCTRSLDKDRIGELLDSFDTKDIEDYYCNLFKESDSSIHTHGGLLINSYIEKRLKNTSNDTYTYMDINYIDFQVLLNNLVYLNNHKYINAYKNALSIFIVILSDKIKPEVIDDKFINESIILLNRCIKLEGLSILHNFNTFNEITLFNRLGNISFSPNSFSYDQLRRFNTKELNNTIELFYKINNHKKIDENTIALNDNDYFARNTKTSIFKLSLMIGFERLKYLIKNGLLMVQMEHLSGDVDISNVKLDSIGLPIVNQRLFNMIFNSYDKDLFLKALKDEESDLYKFFPRLFSEWDLITLNGKDKSLRMALDFLKSDTVIVEPKYNKYKGLFKFIGHSRDRIERAKELYDETLKRTVSSIPKVSNTVGEYTYEVLDLHDMYGYTVGNRTNCCFTIKGVANDALVHAMTSPNGRILVVKRGEELIAHSWIWRNGDTLVLDNIEVFKKNLKTEGTIDFVEVYEDFTNKILEKSLFFEKENRIKNIRIGYTTFDKLFPGAKKYPFLLSEKQMNNEAYISKLGNNITIVPSLIAPPEEIKYKDSANGQYIFAGTSSTNEYNPTPIYQDERVEVKYLTNPNEDELDIINGLRQRKCEEENIQFSYLESDDIKYVILGEDWYKLYLESGEIEEYIYSFDERAHLEYRINKIEKTKIKRLVK